MNIAVLLAGGTGQRLGAKVPTVVEILSKPLIVYALQIYERSTYIDAIGLSVYQDIFQLYGSTHHGKHRKAKWVVPGGSSCQESTRNGIFGLEGICSDNDILMFGMSTSVFVDDDIIADSLRVCKQYGNAFAAMQCIYNLAKTSDGLMSSGLELKEMHKTLNMPWTAPYGTLSRLYRKAYKETLRRRPHLCPHLV